MLSDANDKKYWKGLEERDGSSECRAPLQGEFPELPVINFVAPQEADLSRRSFLRAAGFGLAATTLGACSRGPVERAIPLLVDVEESVVGGRLSYASTCGECSAGCGILASTRDGRPIKLEGNPEHPLSQGGICAVGQASLLGLYDSQRLGAPLSDGRPSTWDQLDEAVRGAVDQPGGETYLLTGHQNSPTVLAQIEQLLARVPGSHHVQYDPISNSATAVAHGQTHGKSVVPGYRFERARVVVGFDADFLGTWISPVQFTRDYLQARDLLGEDPQLSYHIQFEGRMTLTGSNADRRVVVSPQSESALLMGLAETLAAKAGAEGQLPWPVSAAGSFDRELIEDLADRLWAARGESLVVMGRNDVTHQRLVNFVNHLLGNYGSTLDLERHSQQSVASEAGFLEMVERMQAGEVGTLIIAGTNPSYSAHRPLSFQEALGKVPVTVCLSQHLDETAQGCRFVGPANHSLESWRDSEPVKGLFGLSQPTLPKLNDSRSLTECLSSWLGERRDGLQIIRDHWMSAIYPRVSGTESFESFWNSCVHGGFLELNVPEALATQFEYAALEPVSRETNRESGEFFLVLYEKIGIRDGRQAGNPWLQELPDPVSKVTWDNYVSLAPETARRLEIEQGDLVRVTQGDRELELPALIQVGQHNDVAAVAVGYGSRLSERFSGLGPDWLERRPLIAQGEPVGQNAFPLAAAPGVLVAADGRVRLQKAGGTHLLALTQTHHNIEIPEALGGHRRDLVRETSYESFLDDPSSGNPPLTHSLELWDRDYVYTGRHWAMAIDLSSCTGCSACVVACQAENNVPVVGRDEVERRREMHWLRIDRYYVGSESNPETVHQPMMCQHCDHAPCEAVCPVLATVHSEEGINQQIYNRCVGTRYCANNCPFKVRRFNWFDYWKTDARENLGLNPDITTRMRGVMEKCSFCTQRIQEAKFEAKRQGREVMDGDIQTACQQSCPARAIHFGDSNDPNSSISRLIESGRHYRLLEEMNFRPSVGYLTKVRNKA